MKQIMAMNFAALRNAEVSGLMATLEMTLLSSLEPENYALLEDFRSARNVYVEVMGNTPDTYRERLEQADRRVDTAWRALHGISELNVLHPDEAVRESSSAILSAMDRYPNPTRLSYDEEYGIIAALLPLLDAVSPEQWKASGLSSWHEELKSSYDAFMEIRREHHEVRASAEPGAVKSAREELISLWKELSVLLPAVAMMKPSESLDNAIDRVNEIIKAKKVVLKGRKKKDEDEAKEDVATSEA